MNLRSIIAKAVPSSVKSRMDRDKVVTFLKEHDEAKALHPHTDTFMLCGMSNKIEKKILSGDYDRINTALVKTLVHEGHVCLDVGANIGAYSVALSKRCSPGGAVHAFEPVNHIRHKLNLNLAVNGARNVTVNNFGLAEKDAELEMHQVKEGVFRAGTSSFVKNPTIHAMGDDKFVIEVAQVRTMDGYVASAGLEKIDFIKIDVEGFELNVLLGGAESIRRMRPSIIMEFDHDRHGESSAEFTKFFAEMRYEVFQVRSIGKNLIVEPFDFSFQPKERNLLCLPMGH